MDANNKNQIKIPRLLRGRVVTVNLPQKMIKVLVSQQIRHPIYEKVITRESKLNVHWEGEQELRVGDLVDIMESRPISKIKRHIFVRKAI